MALMQVVEKVGVVVQVADRRLCWMVSDLSLVMILGVGCLVSCSPPVGSGMSYVVSLICDCLVFHLG